MHQRPIMQEQITQWLRQWRLDPWAWNLILIGAALLLGLVIRLLLSLFIRKKAEETRQFSLFYSLLQHLGRPFSWFLPLFFFNLLLPVMRMPADVRYHVNRIVEIGLIITCAWILINAIRVVQDYVFHRFDINKADNLRERKVRTQLQFIRRLVVTFIIGLTVAAVLMTFSSMRRIGTGLLTGVGVGGIIIGFAAQRSLGNLLAGFQIAFTQPIRIDDEVLVENEFGKVEEITLTYVVVRIWDERRLILPINYFIEKPFQNWTRTSTQLLGTIFLYTDYAVPIDALRNEQTRLLQGNALWDGRVNSMVVTNTTDRTVEVRALVSSESSGKNFDLRCFLREQLINFINREYPDSLPKSRVELEKLPPVPQPQAPQQGVQQG